MTRLYEDQARQWIEHHGKRWLTPHDVLTHPSLRSQLSAWVYAGPNPMAHHGSKITAGGMAGAAQMFGNLYSAENAKFLAGDWIRTARENRALGRQNTNALAKAAMWRATARDRQRAMSPVAA